MFTVGDLLRAMWDSLWARRPDETAQLRVQLARTQAHLQRVIDEREAFCAQLACVEAENARLRRAAHHSAPGAPIGRA